MPPPAVDMTQVVMEALRLQTEAFARMMREQSDAATERARAEADERREANASRKPKADDGLFDLKKELTNLTTSDVTTHQ